jgi:hypothetical protein
VNIHADIFNGTFHWGVSFPANGLVFSQKRNQHSVKGAPSYNAWPTFWRDQIRNLRPASILASGCFLYVLKLCDLDGTFRELGGDFEFSAHGFDEILKRAHVHIRAALEFIPSGAEQAAEKVPWERLVIHSGCW